MDIRLTSLKKLSFCSLDESSFSALTATRTSFWGSLSMRPVARPEREMRYILQVFTHSVRPWVCSFPSFPRYFAHSSCVSLRFPCVPLKHNSGRFPMASWRLSSYASHPLTVNCHISICPVSPCVSCAFPHILGLFIFSIPSCVLNLLPGYS